MSQNRNAPAATGAPWTAARAASQSVPYCTTSATARQAPAWVASKLAADRSWPAVRSLLLALGFSDPTPADLASDWRGVDVTATRGGRRVRLAWRNRRRKYFGYRDVTVRLARPSGASTEVQKWGAADLALWTWSEPSGAVTDWLLLRCDRVAPLLAHPWPALRMPDATAVCISWQSLSQAGAIVAASVGVTAALP